MKAGRLLSPGRRVTGCSGWLSGQQQRAPPLCFSPDSKGASVRLQSRRGAVVVETGLPSVEHLRGSSLSAGYRGAWLPLLPPPSSQTGSPQSAAWLRWRLSTGPALALRLGIAAQWSRLSSGASNGSRLAQSGPAGAARGLGPQAGWAGLTAPGTGRVLEFCPQPAAGLGGSQGRGPGTAWGVSLLVALLRLSVSRPRWSVTWCCSTWMRRLTSIGRRSSRR